MDNGNNNIFRQQALDKASSPDELNKYIRSVSPKLWFLLTAIIVLLVGAIVWSCIGYVETKGEVVAVVESSSYSITLTSDDARRMKDSSFVRINNTDYPISELITSTSNNTDIYYTVKGDSYGITDGVYEAYIVFNKLHPMQFILN